MTTRVRATACRLKKTSLLSTGFTPLGYLRRNCSYVSPSPPVLNLSQHQGLFQ